MGEDVEVVTRSAARSVTSQVLRRWPVLIFAAALAYLVLVPLFRLQQLAFADGAAGYHTSFGAPSFGHTLATTVKLALGALLVAMVLGTSLALAARRLPPSLSALRVVPILPIALPAVATIAGWAFLLSPVPGYVNILLRDLPWWSHLREGPIDVFAFEWIVIITGISLSAFVYLFVTAGLRNVNSELIDAARVSGLSGLQTTLRVTMPLLRPVLVYSAAVVFMLGLGQFTGPLLLGRQNQIDVLATDMLGYASRTPTDFGAAAALGSPLLLIGIAVIGLQRFVLRDNSRYVTHGGPAFRPDRRHSRLAVAYIVGFGLVAIVLPVLALIGVALSPYWTGRIDPSLMSLDQVRKTMDNPAVLNALRTSLTTSLVAVAIALPLGFAAARLLLNRRRFSPVRWLIDLLVTLPLGIPAVIFGVGFLLTYTKAPLVLYGTRWVMILVYVTLMIPFTTRMQLSGMVALGERYAEAARVSGAGPFRTTLSVTLPLLRSTIAGAAALMFVLLSHEFSASILVRSSRTQVMGTVFYDFWTNGSYPVAATMGLLMGIVTATGLAVAVWLGGASVFERL